MKIQPILLAAAPLLAAPSCCEALAGCIATAKSEGHPWMYQHCIDALGDCCVAEKAD
jgi:hypothetical protein